MLKIDIGQDASFNEEAPVKVFIPSSFISPSATVFTLNKDGLWSNTGIKTGSPQSEALEEGASLFIAHCAPCHNQNLRLDLTGPALGNVQQFRDLDWLVAFTKNSQNMIAQGDPIALCLWSQWKPIIMNDFDTLSDTQILNIYQFIANESKVQNIKPDEVNYIANCNLERVVDTISIFTSPNLTLDTLYYSLDIYESGWKNVDFFINDTTRIDRIELEVEVDRIQDIEIVLAIEDRKIVIPFYMLANGVFVLQSSERKFQYAFPVGEKTKIIAFRKDPITWEVTEFVIQEYITREKGNKVKLKPLKAGTTEEFNAAIN